MVKLSSNPTCVLSDADVITNEQAERIAKVLTKHLPGAGDVTESGKILGVDANGDVALVEDKTGSTYTAGTGLTLENGEFSVDNPMPGSSGASQGDVLTIGSTGPEWIAPEVGGVEVVSGPYKPNWPNTSIYLTRGIPNNGAPYGPWTFNDESNRGIMAFYGVQAIQFYAGMALLPSSVVLSQGEYNIHLVVGLDSSDYAVYNESIGTFDYRYDALARAGFVQITQYDDDASKWTVVGNPAFVGGGAQYWVTVAGSTGGTAPNGEIAMCSCLDAGWDCSFLVLSYMDVSTLDFNKAYINSNMPPQLGQPGSVLTVAPNSRGLTWANACNMVKIDPSQTTFAQIAAIMEAGSIPYYYYTDSPYIHTIMLPNGYVNSDVMKIVYFTGFEYGAPTAMAVHSQYCNGTNNDTWSSVVDSYITMSTTP